MHIIMKTIQDCILFTNENPICYLATVEGDQPRVRALGFWFADETGFYFQTGSIKELTHQLEKNPKAEACFYKSEGAMLRIAGKVEFVNDKALKEKAFKDRPFLKSFGWTAESPELIIFRIAHGEAHFWTMEDNLKAKEIIRF
jgi:uncharacterized pyridoxamine 5'-phosphate oxidase family protein